MLEPTAVVIEKPAEKAAPSLWLFANQAATLESSKDALRAPGILERTMLPRAGQPPLRPCRAEALWVRLGKECADQRDDAEKAAGE